MYTKFSGSSKNESTSSYSIPKREKIPTPYLSWNMIY